MALETGTYISDLVATNPVGSTDSKSTLDDHIRLIKEVIQATFPNITGAMTATHAEINAICDGFSLTSSDDKIDNFPSGTLMLFQQTAAPTGWTKQTTHNDKGLRVVSGTASSGGTDAFSTTFDAAKATDSHALTTAEIPSHTHGIRIWSHNGDACYATPHPTTANKSVGSECDNSATLSAGSGNGHSHTVTMDLQYVDIIIASKD